MPTILVAHDEDRVIGNKGCIPWYIPADLKRFKEITLHKAVIMGRKTFDSLPNGPLPNRLNIIISSTMQARPGLVIAKHPEEAVELAGDLESFIIGGESIYRSFLYFKLVDKVIATEVYGRHEGDTRFPYLYKSEGWSSEVIEEQVAYRIVEWLHMRVLRRELDDLKQKIVSLRRKLRQSRRDSDLYQRDAARRYRSACDFVPYPDEDD